FHHVAMLSEIQRAADSGALYTYHFNMLRSILEKTAIFFGHDDFSACIRGVEDEVLYARALNLLSHGKYAIYEPREMVEDTKRLFRKILDAFLTEYRFALPNLLTEATTSTLAEATTPTLTEATTPSLTEATAPTTNPS